MRSIRREDEYSDRMKDIIEVVNALEEGLKHRPTVNYDTS
jgi:hypothetical protein